MEYLLIPKMVMGAVFALLSILVAISLWRVHRDKKLPDLLDLLTATDKKGIVRFDARKCFEAGAFAVSTWGFVFITMEGKLTEFYFAGYMGAWVGARYLRDREKRLEATKGAIK